MPKWTVTFASDRKQRSTVDEARNKVLSIQHITRNPDSQSHLCNHKDKTMEMAIKGERQWLSRSISISDQRSELELSLILLLPKKVYLNWSRSCSKWSKTGQWEKKRKRKWKNYQKKILPSKHTKRDRAAVSSHWDNGKLQRSLPALACCL